MIKAGIHHNRSNPVTGRRISAEDDEGVTIPTPVFFFTLGFFIGGIFMPALGAGSRRLSDIAVGRVSGR